MAIDNGPFLGVVMDDEESCVIPQPPKQQYSSGTPVPFQEHWYYQHLDHQLLYSAPLIIVSNNNNIACTFQDGQRSIGFSCGSSHRLKQTYTHSIRQPLAQPAPFSLADHYGCTFSHLHQQCQYVHILKTLGRGVKMPGILNH